MAEMPDFRGIRAIAGARRHLAIASLAAFLIPLLFAAPLAADQAGQGGKLHLFFWQAPDTLNPHLSAARQDLSASRIVYEPLASLNGKGQLVPFLAKEIPSLQNGGLAEDGRSVVWKLKPGITWSDGTAFTAADVVFTHDYITYSPAATGSASAYDEVWSVEALDDLRVKITFKTPQAAWSKPFVGAKGMILPRHIFASHIGAVAPDAPANRMAVGTGPYRVVSFEEEDVLVIDDQVIATIKIIYEPNPYFRESGKPYFSIVELQGGGEDAKIAAKAAREGLTDFAWNLAGDALALKLLGAGDGRAIHRSSSWIEGLTVVFANSGRLGDNQNPAPVPGPRRLQSDWRLSQALAHSIDQEAILGLYRAAGHSAATSPAWTHGGLAANGETTFDLARAGALFTEAGWVDRNGDGRREKNGRALALFFQPSHDPLRQGVENIIAEALRSLGVKVGPEGLDATAFFGPLLKNETRQDSLLGWPAQIGKLAADPLFQRADFGRDLGDGAMAVYPLVLLRQSAGISKTLAGVAFTPWDLPLWNIKDWRRK
jgi:peptide/nickel transport system substrate-binding protein